MRRQKKITIDFRDPSLRLSQRTYEATLVVGKKSSVNGEDKKIKQEECNTDKATAKKKSLPLNFGKRVGDASSSSRDNRETRDQNESTQNRSDMNTLEEPDSPQACKPVAFSVKFHESRTSTETVIVDYTLVPGAKPGDIGEIQSFTGSKRKFFFTFTESHPDSSKRPSLGKNELAKDGILGTSTTLQANVVNEFKVDDKQDENSNNVISILSGTIAYTLDLKPRSQVLVRVRTKESVQADTVEIYVKDIHLTRGDMWHISNLLKDRCVYKNEKVQFLNGSIRLSINHLYKNGHKFFSSYVGNDTKIVFRSDSARLIVFIQISSEMWNFEESGQQMFHKLMNSFFPNAFQKWKDLGTHHLITIILFSSVDIGDGRVRYAEGETPVEKMDYYRVVVDQVHILLWNEIMATLRLEFANFKKDICIRKNEHRDAEHPQESIIVGEILPSAKGSVLEAINLGMSLVSDDFMDSYLRTTTNHFIFITPGTGLFDVTYDMLIRTSKLMSVIDSTVDIICLSQPPLHIVPLVRYLDNQNRLKHCIPNWLDISFWTDTNQAVHQWLPKGRIYDLQMMGVMENEVSSVNIRDLELVQRKTLVEAMNDYDRSVFIGFDYFGSGDKKAKLQKDFIRNASRVKNRDETKLQNITHQSKDEKLNPQELIVPNDKSTTETFNAFGVTTTSKPNVSAFSSLLSLSKNSDVKTPATTAYNFVKKMISTPMLKPLSSANENDVNTINELDNDQLSLDTSIVSVGSNSRPDRGASVSTATSSANSLSVSPKSASLIKERNRKNKKSLTKGKSLDRKPISNIYWTNINNPSKPLTKELLSMISYGRWRYVFPPNVKRRTVKWSSLSSPAALPIFSSIFPSLSDFNQNYTFRIYDVIINQDTRSEYQTSETLLKNMISLRLSLGFQICIGEEVEKIEKHRKPNGDSKLLIQFLSEKNYIGSRIYLSLGNEIHRICCEYNGLINVQVYKRVSSSDEVMTLSTDKKYVENIRTRYSEEYTPVMISSSANKNVRNYNWNQMDQVLAGYEDYIDKKKYHRMKFVILPSAIPENVFTLNNEKLTTEEMRLEGIRSLIMNIYRIRYRSKEERNSNKKLEIAPEIHFYTGNLYEYLKTEGEQSRTNGQKSLEFNKNMNISKLIKVLEGPHGIPIMNRRWHMKNHSRCFVGMDLVNFLIENFTDIDTREEAVEYGNLLMSKNVIQHVISKHHFLDGHYFYRLNKEAVEEFADGSSGDDNKSVVHDRVGHDAKTKKIILSKEVFCDLDPNGYSWQPENVKVHYDIVHNPLHCFHLRIEWLNTTTKLIEDMISGWGKHCERYGLSLVEVPWDELFTLPLKNPLHSTIEITLAVDPWTDPEFSKYSNIFERKKYYFHLYLLEKCTFMLDNRTATYLAEDALEVEYSWGKPEFKHAQFVHSTGGYIAELRKKGDLFLAPNNAYISRLNLNVGKQHNLGKSTAVYFDSQSVMLEFRAICTDEKRLREIFREGLNKWNDGENDIEDIATPVEDNKINDF
ncbi:hypothetical protein CANINC_001502 [Pichia inconspicua]|uniref:Vacuolar membrane-associated protein IML1 n=1 Tax=Pichia inconspicua TaxID=52247 RepID=A0A4V4NFZ4_9ASCO|nr:hypothetical protein CANINC_001502 [[Candida] inconspicua]